MKRVFPERDRVPSIISSGTATSLDDLELGNKGERNVQERFYQDASLIGEMEEQAIQGYCKLFACAYG